jgi:hypothetical protein
MASSRLLDEDGDQVFEAATTRQKSGRLPYAGMAFVALGARGVIAHSQALNLSHIVMQNGLLAATIPFDGQT